MRIFWDKLVQLAEHDTKFEKFHTRALCSWWLAVRAPACGLFGLGVSLQEHLSDSCQLQGFIEFPLLLVVSFATCLACDNLLLLALTYRLKSGHLCEEEVTVMRRCKVLELHIIRGVLTQRKTTDVSIDEDPLGQRSNHILR